MCIRDRYFTGLPELLVAAHLLGVCFMVAGATVAVDSLYRRPALSAAEPAAQPAGDRDAALTASSRMPS